MKSGFITILGRPNVGKSTFLNTILKQKICIMSDKPQTTRNVILGIHTEEDVQMIFMDTPGIHKPKHELGKMMTDMAYQTIKSVDVVLFMISAVDPIGTGDRMIIEHLKMCNVPVYLIINKIDLLKSKMSIDKVILDYMNLLDFKGVFPISAKDNLNIDHLLDDLKELLPEGPMYFPEDQITDHPERFIVSELIREQVLKLTSEEIPHSVAVVIESMRPNEEREDIIDIYATIICERSSQKGIIIGKDGQMLKKIGTNARKEIINLLGSKTHLELWVKVKKDWRNKQLDLKNFGYNLDEY